HHYSSARFINRELFIFSCINPSHLLHFGCECDPRDLHSFPTRRSSDLCSRVPPRCRRMSSQPRGPATPSVRLWRWSTASTNARLDRKSTRLNSSHVKISYAVFCLKNKNGHNCIEHSR